MLLRLAAMFTVAPRQSTLRPEVAVAPQIFRIRQIRADRSHHPWSEEHQQVFTVIGLRIAAEQPAEDRYVLQKWKPETLLIEVIPIDTAHDHGLTAAHEHMR